MILCLIEAVLGYVVLMFVGTNLVGFALRAPALEAPAGADPFIANEYRKAARSSHVVSLVTVLLAVLYLYLLWHFWNGGVAAAAMILMVSRVPDLLWEMRAGRRITTGNAPKGIMGSLTAVLTWGALPLLWFSLCQ